jgi:polyhydroxybutyrate depolymerase
MANPFDAPPPSAPIDTQQPNAGADDSKAVALKMLQDVHLEMDTQKRVRQNENGIAHAINFFYDPMLGDDRRLKGIAGRLDKAADNGDYDIITAQKPIIDKELAADQKHVDRKTSIDDIASDAEMVLPMLSIANLFEGSGTEAKRLLAKLEGTDKPEPQAPLKAITGPGDYTEQINVNGTERSYKVHVPPGYQPGKPMPSVIMLHGISEDADSFAELTNMNAKADKEGFITIYPEGNPILHNDSHLAWNVPNWGIFHPARKADDVKFVSEVIDRASKEMSIDPNRTYVAGFSNGGMLAQEVASQNADKVAAVALVGTALSGKDKTPSNPVSVIDIHGTSDPVVPYENWDNSLKLVKMQPVSYTSDYWKQADGINGQGQYSVKGNIVSQDSVNAKTGVEVKQIGVIGGVHTWPGKTNVDTADQSFDATDEIWNFFSHHTRANGSAAGSSDSKVIQA